MPGAFPARVNGRMLVFAKGALTASAAFATLCIMFNAIAYSATTAMSTLISDSWYFVESFLMKYYQRGLDLGMLLSKRSAVDHAGPIQKLILLADARIFGLDFRMEGLFGVFAGVLTLVFAALLMRRLKWGDNNANLWSTVGLAALSAVYLSMNAPVIFEWPLVSLYFVIVLIVFGFFAVVLHALETGRYWLAALASFACMLAVDDIGMLAWIAAAGVMALALLRGQVARRRAISTLVAIGVGLAASRAVYALYTDSFSPGHASVWQRAAALLAIGPGGFAKAVVIVLSAPVIHKSQIAGATDALQWTQIGIALIVGALHLWFWISQWNSKQTFLGRFAAALMLFFYLLAAGILYGRVPEFGVDYLHSPRYVQFYGLGLVAIVLQLQVSIASAGRAWSWPKTILLGSTVVLLTLQCGYIDAGWKRAPFVAQMDRQMAMQMRAAANPANTQPMSCFPQMVICRRPFSRREAVLGFLQTWKLNAFSPRVQALRGLDTPGGSPRE